MWMHLDLITLVPAKTIMKRLKFIIAWYWSVGIGECNADQADIFFIDTKTQFTEIFGENIGDYFEKY